MDTPEGGIDDSKWLEVDRTPWIGETLSIPEDREYDAPTRRLLEEAHAAEFLTNKDIKELGTDFAEIFIVVVGIVQANGIDPGKQFKEWDLFEFRRKTE